MWVIKVGGSLQDDTILRVWLDVITDTYVRKVVLVPGGGRFANLVRRAQERWNLDDLVTHRMALLAMEQYGRLLCALNKNLVPAASKAEIEAAWNIGRHVVWLPYTMLSAAEVPTDWRFTADSGALWLATELDADHVFLLKSVCLGNTGGDLDKMTAAGYVDECFAEYGKRFDGGIRWLFKDEASAYQTMIRSGRTPGEPVRHANTDPAERMHAERLR